MKVVVTGATGFVAGHLLPALTEAGHGVVALAHEPDRLGAPPGVLVIEADLRRPLDRGAIGPVDSVVHLAQANVPFPDGARDLWRVNAQSTAELLELAKEAGASRFVLASSGSIYGLGQGAVAEDDPRRATDFYAVTKRAAELVVGAYAPYMHTAVLRLFTPYGPRQTGRLVPSLVDRIRSGRPVTLNAGGRPRLTPVFVLDLVRVVLAALEREGNHVVNVAGDEVVGIQKLAQLIGEAVGREPVFKEKDGDAPGDLIGVNARMHELYAPGPLVPLAEGIRATVEADALA